MKFQLKACLAVFWLIIPIYSLGCGDARDDGRTISSASNESLSTAASNLTPRSCSTMTPEVALGCGGSSGGDGVARHRRVPGGWGCASDGEKTGGWGCASDGEKTGGWGCSADGEKTGGWGCSFHEDRDAFVFDDALLFELSVKIVTLSEAEPFSGQKQYQVCLPGGEIHYHLATPLSRLTVDASKASELLTAQSNSDGSFITKRNAEGQLFINDLPVIFKDAQRLPTTHKSFGDMSTLTAGVTALSMIPEDEAESGGGGGGAGSARKSLTKTLD
jgi:hypothetical protein